MVRRFLAGTGRVLISVGVLLLLFVAYQLWGTGIAQAQDQKQLGTDFERTLDSFTGDAPIVDPSTGELIPGFDEGVVRGSDGSSSAPDETTAPSLVGDSSGAAVEDPSTAVISDTIGMADDPFAGPGVPVAPASAGEDNPAVDQVAVATVAPTTRSTPVSTLPKPRAGRSKMKVPDPGQVLGKISIPAIKRADYFVTGSDVESLKRGPGHYPGTPLPGHEGNVAIAGHRTTYGQPFFNLDLLKKGDSIFLQTIEGKFEYSFERSFIVDDNDASVLQNVIGENILTLTTCHPKYSAAKRLIVRARLIGPATEADFFFEPEEVPVTMPPTTAAPTTAVPTTLAPTTTTASVSTLVSSPSANATTPTTAPPTVPITTIAEPVESSALDTIPNESAIEIPGGENADQGKIVTVSWLSGPISAWLNFLKFAAVCGAIWFVAWLIARRRRFSGQAVIYLVGLVPFLVMLYHCYENLAKLLPENI